VIDATFNTNKKRLPLLIIVGVMNLGKTFSIAFSFYSSEFGPAFKFFFKCLSEECFINRVIESEIVLGD
jgi:MULE transposase domain